MEQTNKKFFLTNFSTIPYEHWFLYDGEGDGGGDNGQISNVQVVDLNFPYFLSIS